MPSTTTRQSSPGWAAVGYGRGQATPTAIEKAQQSGTGSSTGKIRFWMRAESASSKYTILRAFGAYTSRPHRHRPSRDGSSAACCPISPLPRWQRSAPLIHTDRAGIEATVADLTDLLWTSIDNQSSRDLDQLSVAVPLACTWHARVVAIADVDALVPAGSAIDAHARTNTTTVYTAAGIFSMIPERLSTDLTSLNQDEERLAVVVQMDVGDDGTVDTADVYRARAFAVARASATTRSRRGWMAARAPPEPVASGPGTRREHRAAGSRRAGDERVTPSTRRAQPGHH